MKREWQLFLGAAGFFAITGTVYWFASYEEAGTVMLALTVGAMLMIAGWLAFQSRRFGPRPEDRPDADPEDGAEDIGYFPTSSIWPFVMACGAVVVSVAFVFGVWLGLAGILLLVIGIIGYAMEANTKA